MLRWPGGCFAEIYDWRDGIGPREKRPVRINWWHNHDHRYEPNEVGTDEFIFLPAHRSGVYSGKHHVDDAA